MFFKSTAKMRNVFFVPTANYEAALEVIGDRVDVVAVETLDDALAALQERGGNTEGIKSSIDLESMIEYPT